MPWATRPSEIGNAEVAALLPDIQAVFEAAGEAMTALSEGDAARRSPS